jgi:hypothetical protein
VGGLGIGIHKKNRPLIFVAGKLIGANWNITTDQPIALTGTSLFVPFMAYCRNASIAMTTALGAFYPSAGKTGTPFFSTAALNNATFAPNVQMLGSLAQTYRFPVEIQNNGTIYFSLTTAQGAPATADIWVYGLDLTQ